MRRLRDFLKTELHWTQPQRLKRFYELRSGDQVLATLQWEKIFGSLATACTSEGQWTFKRGGFLRPHVTVRRAGSEASVAVFEAWWTGGGELVLPSGQRYRWQSHGFWRSRWSWSAGQQEIAAFSAITGVLKREARLEIPSDQADLTELPLLAALGWYLLILAGDDAAGAAAAAS